MQTECSWCQNKFTSHDEAFVDLDHRICLDCIDTALRKIGEDAEHRSWLLAFKVERLYSDRSSKKEFELTRRRKKNKG